MRRILVVLCAFFALSALAATPEPAALTITLDPLGDTTAGVVARVSFKLPPGLDSGPQTALVLQGSYISHTGQVLKNFRYEVPADRHDVVTTIQTFAPGDVTIEARLVMPIENDTAPVLLGKSSAKFTVAKTNKQYVASAEDGAEAIFAEGIVPESSGAVRIRVPRRDVAPNLFIVNVEVLPPVQRVEFWVEGKKILARNAPPYSAELDLGKLPKRVEVRAVGYDAQGHYIDADSFIVNERETPLEVKITRTETPDGVSHFKLSLQNPKNTTIKTVALYAGQKKIYEWAHPPYALDLPTSRLTGVEFVRASAIDDTGYEATDLFFMSGQRYTEEIEVNLVELPVSVADANGIPIGDLKQENFSVFENGKPQKINAFNFAANLPISVGLLVDHSGSMEKRMQATKEAASAFFRSILKPGDRAFIGGFANDPARNAPWVTDVNSLEQQVQAVPDAGGGTSLYDAIITGLYRFRTLQGRKALIVLTDGEDTTSRLAYDDMLTYARAARVPLYFIGIGLGFSDVSGTSKMRALAAETGGVAYFIRDVKQLAETYTALEKDLRSQYLVSYLTESTKKDQSYRTVEVKVDRPGAKVRTIRGFIP